MNKLDELIKELTNSQSVVKYKKLENIINNNEVIRRKYDELLELQKALVKSENSVLIDTSIAQKNYDNHLSSLTSEPVISEYLSALEDVNEDLNMIQNIIEQEINNEIK